MAKILPSSEINNTYETFKVRLLDRPFFRSGTQEAHSHGIINLSESQTSHLHSLAESYNTANNFKSINSKGRFKNSHQDTVRKLLYFAAKQVEEMRIATPSRYLLEMSDNIPLIQLRTNRKGLAAALGCGERKVHDHVKFLMTAKVKAENGEEFTVIGRKTVASNIRTVQRDKIGRPTAITYNLMKDDKGNPVKGRGDWTLWIDKRAFFWNVNVGHVLKNSLIDNQPLSNNKRRYSPSTVPQKKKDTILSISIAKSIKGASHTFGQAAQSADKEPRSTHVQEPMPGTTEKIDLGGRRQDETDVLQLVEGFDVRGAAAVTRAETDVLRNISAQAAREVKPEHIPGTNFRNSLIAFLVILYQKRLFPRVSQTYWQHYSDVLHNQFALLMGAVQSGLIDDDKQNKPNLHSKVMGINQHFAKNQLEMIAAFAILRRGIMKAYENMRKHPDRFAEGSLRTSPIRYLDINRQDSAFSFEKVLMMVKNECETARRRVDEQHRLFKWKVPFARKEVLVTRAYCLLANKEFDKFTAYSKETYHTLKTMANEVDMPTNQRNNLFNSFIIEIQTVKRVLEERAGLDVSKQVIEFVRRFREEQMKKVA